MTQTLKPSDEELPTLEPSDEELRLEATERALVQEFGPVLGEDRVRSGVRDVVRRYDEAPVRTFLAVLVEREARARLRNLSAGAPA